MTTKIGFGGGCHWCTEAVFTVLTGVEKVEQGWIASEEPYDSLSEGVIVHFDPEIIQLSVLIEIHLLTHASTSNHSMRNKYRSAIYTFSDDQSILVENELVRLSKESNRKFVTKVLRFVQFESSSERYQDYYLKHWEKPFCKTYIDPKLKLLIDRFKGNVRTSSKTVDRLEGLAS